MNICRPWRRDVDDETGLKWEKGIKVQDKNDESQESIYGLLEKGEKDSHFRSSVAVLIQKAPNCLRVWQAAA
jgi:hypothetical protein